MNTRNFSFLFVSILILGGCGDGFLDVNPRDVSSVEAFYDSDQDLIEATSAAYSSLGDVNLYSVFYHLQKELLTNDAFSGESGPQFSGHYRFSFNPNQDEIKWIWHSLYEGIRRSNRVLTATPQNLEDEELFERLKDECRFLRALYYWHLWTGWAQFPIRTEENFLEPIIPKGSRDEVVMLMISDLETVIANQRLPYRWNGEVNNEVQRATLGAAHALLGKIYLYEERYSDAVNSFRSVTNISEDFGGGMYGLMSDFSQVWNLNNEVNKEILFSVTFCGFDCSFGFNPFFSDGFNAIESTLRTQYLYRNGFYNIIPTDELRDFYQDEDGDSRLLSTIVTTGDIVPWGETYVFDGLSIVKGMSETPNATNGNFEDFPLLRLADVYLMMAEALHLSGSDAEAMQFIDLVRARAFGTNYTSTSDLMVNTGKDLLTVIKDERRKELAYECHRFNDLRRWGDLSTIVDFNGGSRYSIPGTEFWPIPRGEIDRSGGVLVQNEPY